MKRNNENQRLICGLKSAVFALDFQSFQKPHPLPEDKNIRLYENKMQYLVSFGILFVFIGMILIIIGSLAQAKTAGGKESDVKVAVGGFIGPIPFGFFSDKKMVIPFIGLLIFLAVLFLVMIYLSKYYFRGV